MCQHVVEDEGWLRKHVEQEIEFWQCSFYDVEGVDKLELGDVKWHGCGICSEQAAYKNKEALISHVVSTHRNSEGRTIVSQDQPADSQPLASFKDMPPAKTVWDYSTVFESLLKMEEFHITGYRPSKHRDRVVAFLWPRTKTTLAIFRQLQEGTWPRGDRSDKEPIEKFVKEACNAATHCICEYNGVQDESTREERSN